MCLFLYLASDFKLRIPNKMQQSTFQFHFSPLYPVIWLLYLLPYFYIIDFAYLFTNSCYNAIDFQMTLYNRDTFYLLLTDETTHY